MTHHTDHHISDIETQVSQPFEEFIEKKLFKPDDWVDRVGRLGPDEVMEVSSERIPSSDEDGLANVLRGIVKQLKASEGHGFRASILVRDTNNTMLAVICLSEQLDSEFNETKADFNWEQPINGIAALCMYIRNSICVPDVEDKDHPYSDFWVRPTSDNKLRRSGGIVAVPIFDEANQNVLAVLSITSTEPGFFQPKDEAKLTLLAKQIRRPISQYTGGFDLEGYNNTRVEIDHSMPDDARNFRSEHSDKFLWYLRGLSENWDRLSDESRIEVIGAVANSPFGIALFDVLRGNQDLALGDEKASMRQLSQNDWLNPEFVTEVFEKLMNTLSENSRRPPVRVQRIWKAFQNRENEIISALEIAKQFGNTQNPENDARGAITWLNRAFEKFGIDLEIQHIPAYRLQRRIVR